MTFLIPAHRALAVKFVPRTFKVTTRLASTSLFPRAESSTNESKNPSDFNSQCLRRFTSRSWLKAEGTTAPKAKSTRATKSTSSKPGPKTTAGKKKIAAADKAKARPKAAAKPKPKEQSTKAKPKAKPVRKPKKPLSETAIRKKRVAETKLLREKALLKEPKTLPQSAWHVIFAEAHQKGQDRQFSAEVTKEAALKYKTLTPEELEHYNHIANSNKRKNEAAYKAFVLQYTPSQIQSANLARRALKRKSNTQLRRSPKTYKPIQDDRLPKLPMTNFFTFAVERYASGDFKMMPVAEAQKLISREWKALSASERTKFDDLAKADQNRYLEECKTVYGSDPPSAST